MEIDWQSTRLAGGGWLHNENEVEKTSHGLAPWLACSFLCFVLPGKVRSAAVLVGMTSLWSAPAGRAENPDSHGSS